MDAAVGDIALDDWASAVSSQHGRLTIAASDTRYRGAIASRASARFRVVAWHGDEEDVQRTGRHVREDPRGTLGLFAPLTGSAVVEQAGHRLTLQPGGMVLCDMDRPTRFSHGDGFSALALVVPQSLFAARTDRRSSVAEPVDRGHGIGRVAFDLLRAVWAERSALRDQEFDAACERAVDMLCLGLSGSGDAGLGDVSDVEASIRRFVDEHAADPRLDGTAVAAALGWSLRYVQAVLQKAGTSPSELIRSRRLSLARARLERDPRTPIGVIAGACGFGSPASFSTAFRAYFGVSPRDVRGLRPR